MRIAKSGRSDFFDSIFKKAQPDPYVGSPDVPPELYKQDPREAFPHDAEMQEEGEKGKKDQVPHTQLSAIQPQLNMLLSWVQKARSGDMQIGQPQLEKMEKILADAIGAISKAEKGDDISASFGEVPF